MGTCFKRLKQRENHRNLQQGMAKGVIRGASIKGGQEGEPKLVKVKPNKFELIQVNLWV